MHAFPPQLFDPPVIYAADSNLRAVGAADLNHDGFPDLFTISVYENRVSIHLNDQNGVFVFLAGYSVGTDPRAVLAADLNGDSNLDIVAANDGSTYSNATDSVSVLMGNGDGTFNPATHYDLAPNSSPRDLAAADLDGDGDLDLAVATHGRLGSHDTDHFVEVLLNYGDGSFGSSARYDILYIGNPNGTGATQIHAEDLDGDGDRDLVTRNLGSDDLSVLLGNGDGTFAVGTHYAYPGIKCVATDGAAFADFDEDGDLDVVMGCNYSSTGGSGVMFVPGYGDGSFPGAFDPALTKYELATGMAPVRLVDGDFNGDGHLDVVTVNVNSSNVSAIYGNGDGTFMQAGEEPATAPAPQGIAAADFDGDGWLDVATVNFLYPSYIEVFRNRIGDPEPEPPPPTTPALSSAGALLFLLLLLGGLGWRRRRGA